MIGSFGTITTTIISSSIGVVASQRASWVVLKGSDLSERAMLVAGALLLIKPAFIPMRLVWFINYRHCDPETQEMKVSV